jgi:hypothetical protein
MFELAHEYTHTVYGGALLDFMKKFGELQKKDF